MDIAQSLQDLYPSLIRGDIAAAHAMFDDRATIDTPLGGKQLPHEWITAERSWLAAHDATTKEGATVFSEDRIAHEFILGLDIDRRRVALPVLVVADVEDDLLRDLRVYHSTWPLSGGHMLRGPIREPEADAAPPEPVAAYEQALSAGDVDAIQSLFEDDGYVREPSGDDFMHAGKAREEFYGPLRKAGGVSLRTVCVTDDGFITVVEYICDEWGGTKLAAQAGAAVWERAASGKIAGVRIYDDVTPPEGLSS